MKWKRKESRPMDKALLAKLWDFFKQWDAIKSLVIGIAMAVMAYADFKSELRSLKEGQIANQLLITQQFISQQINIDQTKADIKELKEDIRGLREVKPKQRN